MNKLLVVYNTCGILRQNENPQQYISNIQSILDQNFDDMQIAVSSCLNSDAVKTTLKESFGDKISYNSIDLRLPVSITFNHTVHKCVEKYGEFEGYLYVDSGINFNSSSDNINKLYELFESNKYAMVCARTNEDMGFETWFDSADGTELFEDEKLIVPVGRAVNLHAQIFSHEILKTYGTILPDIFAGQCMESVFTFICAAIKKSWSVHRDVIVHHTTGMDGASAGFLPFAWEMQGNKKWDHLIGTKESILDIIARGKEYGMGYEELQKICMHDVDKFDEQGHALDDRLAGYIRDNIYLQKSQLNYNDIEHNFS